MPRKIEISHRTIVFTVFFLAAVYFLYLIWDILLQIFVALLIMAILNPFVTRLAKYKIPRGLSIILVYIVVIGLISAAVAGVAPPLIEQSTNFVADAPTYIQSLGAGNRFSEQLAGELLVFAGSIPSQIAKAAVSLVGNVITVFTVLIFAFYLLLSREKLPSQSEQFFGSKVMKEINNIIDLLEKKLGGWAIGQLTLMLLIGISTYVGLILLGIPFALSLSILAGLLEIVPYVGPIIAAIPATIIGFSISPFMGLAAASLAFLIQQIENYVFVPKVMEKATGVSPIITLLALSIGFRLAGLVGVIISVPVVITIQVLSKEYLSLR